jgi:hypothetical protein
MPQCESGMRKTGLADAVSVITGLSHCTVNRQCQHGTNKTTLYSTRFLNSVAQRCIIACRRVSGSGSGTNSCIL